jgi:hypothetical protein
MNENKKLQPPGDKDIREHCAPNCCNQLPKSSVKISKSRRVGFSWSALRAKFSRTENWRDGIPKARTAGGMKRKEMATKPPYNLMKDLGLINYKRTKSIYTKRKMTAILGRLQKALVPWCPGGTTIRRKHEKKKKFSISRFFGGHVYGIYFADARFG